MRICTLYLVFVGGAVALSISAAYLFAALTGRALSLNLFGCAALVGSILGPALGGKAVQSFAENRPAAEISQRPGQPDFPAEEGFR
jgi:MFS family permease